MDSIVFPRWQATLLMLCLLSEGLYLPANAQSLYSLAAALPLLIAAVLLWLTVLRRRHVHSLCALLGILPAPTTFVLRMVICLWASLSALRSLLRFPSFWRATVFPEGSQLLPIIILLILTLCAAKHGTLSVVMWSYPAAGLALLTVLLSCLVTLPSCDPTLLSLARPVLPSAAQSCSFLLVLPPLFLCEYHPKLPSRKSCVCGLLLGGGGLALLILRAILVLGTGAAALPYPLFSAAGVYSIGDFLQRGEVLLSCALTTAEAVRIAACLTLFPIVLQPASYKKRTSPRRKTSVS